MDNRERRHQVFISSTFTDLIEERREVTQALLEAECIPAGMELFPAGNTDQWTLIKEVIEQSDYYLVIIGGRYGSTTEEGISYTEQEYDYAIELGIPVMGFVPSEPDRIAVGKTDKDEQAARKLDDFRSKVQMKLTREWSSAADLGGKVTRGLMHLKKNNPRPGWVRGDQALPPETRAEISDLQATIAQLQREIQTSSGTPAQMDHSFAHGEEEIDLDIIHEGQWGYEQQSESGQLTYTWDEIFGAIGPLMMDEAEEANLRSALNSHMLSTIHEDPKGGWSTHWSHDSVGITSDAWGMVLVQLRAVGLISTGIKQRRVSDKSTYWKLTDAGDGHLVSLRAIRTGEIPSSKLNVK